MPLVSGRASTDELAVEATDIFIDNDLKTLKTILPRPRQRHRRADERHS